MKLYDLIHPLVSYMVACRYDAAAGKPLSYDAVLGHVMREFARIRKVGAATPEIAPGLEDACTYTCFYIDYMVHEGEFAFAREWQDLGRSEYHELAGDEKFFDYMRRWLDEDSPLAADHLRLMHAMVGSGFSGALERRSVQLEELMTRAAEKLNLKNERQAKQELLSAEGKPPRSRGLLRRPTLPAIAAVGLGCIIFVCSILYYIHIYTVATEELHDVLSSTLEYIDTDTKLHAHNSDSLVVSHYELPKPPAPAPEKHAAPADAPPCADNIPELPETGAPPPTQD